MGTDRPGLANGRLPPPRHLQRTGRERLRGAELAAMTFPLDVEAPAAARSLVTSCLRGRVAASALDSAQLLVSELVTNSLVHSAPVAGEVVVSVELCADWFRIGVLDSGTDAVIAARPENSGSGSGFGLNLVRILSERWGVERFAGAGTQVWAQLACTPSGEMH